MRTLFVRIYVALVAVMLAGFGAAAAWEQARQRPPIWPVVEALREAPPDIREAFATLDAPEARRRLGEQLEADVRLLPLDARLPPPIADALAAGRVVPPRAGRPLDLWVPVPQGFVHVVPQVRRPVPVPLIVGVVMVGLGVTIALLLVPLERDLGRLAGAAQRFGSGEHRVRAEVRPQAATAHLAGQFNEMASRISRLVEGQQELLLAVSHELRTPLHRLRFAVELLADEAEDTARRVQSEAVQRDLDELDALVGDLLAWARLTEAPSSTRQRVALEPLVRGLLHDVARGHPTLQTELEVDPAQAVWADPAELRRALSNLMHNAGRHAVGLVRVTCEEVGPDLRILVDDDGAGVPEAEREAVLQPFVRLDEARTRDAGGAGLGLALAARVAEAHGGSLAIETAPIGGARVVFSVPLTDADPT